MKLKEVDSLTKMRNTHLRDLAEQESRLSTLQMRKDDELLKLSDLLKSHHSLQQEIFEMEQKLKTASLQMQRHIDVGASDDKVESFAKEIASLEEKGFLLLERVEENELQSKDIRSFLSGLEITIIDIEGEALAEIEKLKHEVKNIELRVSALMEELPPAFKNTLLRTTAKKLAHGPFTRVDSGSCFFCRHKISKLDESEIDMQQILKTCTQCDRIFLPYGS
ncbi:MAG TPA: hypothetical protein VNJ01_08775 [Bacteriovoracaceae bacterium]|nr:hypothetical protein [Bacteriovoracaceae bacterium]